MRSKIEKDLYSIFENFSLKNTGYCLVYPELPVNFSDGELIKLIADYILNKLKENQNDAHEVGHA